MMSGGGSSSYIVYRNALLFLMKILPHYPLIKEHNDLIVSKVEFLIANERQDDCRQDLLVLANSYLAHLKKRQLTMIKRIDFGDEGGKSLQAKEAAKRKAKEDVDEAKKAAGGEDSSKEKVDGESKRSFREDSLPYVPFAAGSKRRKVHSAERGKATHTSAQPKKQKTESTSSSRVSNFA